MKTISGFTFVHNAIDSGYPVVEAICAVQSYVDEIVIVDMQSTDSTRRILEDMRKPFKNKFGEVRSNVTDIKVIDGFWGKSSW